MGCIESRETSGLAGMRFSVVMAAMLLFCMPPAMAADAADHPPPPGPLKPGKSAGVPIAQQTRAGLALVGTGAIIAIVVVTTASSGGGSASNQPNMQSVPATTP
jgi:hypothetical protein